jgi:L-serine dehydratase
VIEAPGLGTLAFDPGRDLSFDYGPHCTGHANGMILKATDAQGDVILEETYYSIGGGFVLTATELADSGGAKAKARADVPYPFETAAEMLEMAQKSGLSIAAMKRANELKFRSAAELDAGIARIWQVMNDCISRGMKGDGILPGGLKVRRRAKGIHRGASGGTRVEPDRAAHDQRLDVDLRHGGERGKRRRGPGRDRADQWRGRRVPAVIRYWLDHVPGASPAKVGDFLLTASAIGGLCKHNASDLGRRMRLPGRGGQRRRHGRGRSLRGAGRHPGTGGKRRRNRAGTPPRHDLRPGQGPGAGALHRTQRAGRDQGGFRRLALAARRRAASGQPGCCIETMRQTGRDMHEKYKETSLGGLRSTSRTADAGEASGGSIWQGATATCFFPKYSGGCQRFRHGFEKPLARVEPPTPRRRRSPTTRQKTCAPALDLDPDPAAMSLSGRQPPGPPARQAG